MASDKILIDIVFRSLSGASLSQLPPDAGPNELEKYAASEETRREAVHALQGLGFEIIGRASRFGVSVSAPSELVRRVFGDVRVLRVPASLTPWVESARIPPPGRFFDQGHF